MDVDGSAASGDDEGDEDDGEKRVLVHPLGTISVRQTVVPLDFRIEVFGNARPAKETRFTIEGAASGEDGDALDLAGVLEEDFAPAQYLDLSDEEKLDSPAFESQPAGRTVEPGELFRGGATAEAPLENARETTLCYETIVEDRRKDVWSASLSDLGHFRDLADDLSYLAEPVEIALAFDDVGAVATGAARNVGSQQYTVPTSSVEATRVDLDAETDTLVATTEPVRTETETFTATVSTDGGEPDNEHTDDGEDSAWTSRVADVTGATMTNLADVGEVSRGGGGANGGPGRSDDRTGTLSVGEGRYVPVDSRDMTPAPFAEGPVSKTQAKRAVARHVDRNPADEGRYQVVAARRVRYPDGDDRGRTDTVRTQKAHRHREAHR